MLPAARGLRVKDGFQERKIPLRRTGKAPTAVRASARPVTGRRPDDRAPGKGALCRARAGGS
ncbi:MAG: hypothetical protein JSV00_00680, partial [bacterium]